MKRQTPVMDAIASINDKAKAFFCMPGHKCDTGFFGGSLLGCDITELSGADNLHNAHGAIEQSQTLHADYIGAEAAYYTTCGSTAGILAMLALFKDKKVIFPRGIHKSVANAIDIYHINPIFLNSLPCDYPSVVKVSDIKSALKEHKNAAAVFVTYPNYFGFCCDIKSIANIAHNAGIPVLADAAHAAHFVYSGLLPVAPSNAGIDIWTESAHKTLPAMSQCACLCVGKNSLVDKNKALNALLDVQTTSPSYVLLASLDYAHAYMREQGENEICRVIGLAKKFSDRLNALPGFSCPDINLPGTVSSDPLKIIIDVSKTGHTGLAIKSSLDSQGIYVEAADAKNLLLMLSAGNTSLQFDVLYKALTKITKVRNKNIYFSPYSMPAAAKFAQNHCQLYNVESINIEQSPGRTAALSAGVYPPAEAVVLRGQRITVEIAGYLIEARRQGFDLFGIKDNNIFVFEEKQ